MKVLMTGSHGFVGTNLIKALSCEHEILRWDARVDQPLPEVDAVIHLAGLAHDTKHTTDAEAYFKVNTLLTQQIYDRFLESSAKKFIFFSSIKAQDGDTPYARSKKKAEDYILSHMDDKKSVYILRPCMIHGPGNKGNLNLLYNVVKKGIPWPLGAFENKRTFTSIDNLCYIINGLLTKDIESGIYNINDDEAVSTNELIGIICSTIGKEAHIWRIPRRLMEGVAKIGSLLHLPLDPERLQKLTDNYVCSNAKIKKALGIEQLPVRAKDGLYKTIKAFEG